MSQFLAELRSLRECFRCENGVDRVVGVYVNAERASASLDDKLTLLSLQTLFPVSEQ